MEALKHLAVLDASIGDFLQEVWMYMVIIVAAVLALCCFCCIGVGGVCCACNSYRKSHASNQKSYNKAAAQYNGASAFDAASTEIADEESAAARQRRQKVALAVL